MGWRKPKWRRPVAAGGCWREAEPFGPLLTLTIDGRWRRREASVLSAVAAGPPSIPVRPSDLPPAGQRGGVPCNLCLVEVEGLPGLHKACSTPVEKGLSIITDSPALQSARRSHLAQVLGHHPHVCLTCPQRDGCARTECSYGNPVEARCCSIFASCELRKVSDYIGIPNNTPTYRPGSLPSIKDEPFYDRDYNLCIDCRRCLVACNEVRGVGCLETKNTDG